jgi:S-formylglutathione hydrolase FrmB
MRREHVELPTSEPDDATYFASPTGYVPNAHGDHLQWLQQQVDVDLWGQDVSHDWPWWQRQLAYHLPRFC